MLLNKNILAIGIVFLFMVSSVTPMVIGYRVETTQYDFELDKQLDDFHFMCTDANGLSTDRYEHYKEQLLEQFSSEDSNDDIVIKGEKEESKIPIESPSSPASSGPMDSPWPMQSHDIRHTGQSPFSTADNPHIEKWRFYSSGWVNDGPVIDSDGIIYFAGEYGNLDHLLAIYPDGTEKWHYRPGDSIKGSTPAIAEDGTIYMGAWDHYLHAINPDGTRKWKFHANAANIASSPAIAEDGTIYFGTLWSLGDGGKIHAVNPDGTEKWHYQTGYAITSDPAIGDDGTIYIGSGDKYLYAMNPNGTLKWRFKTGDEIHGHPAIGDDGTIYIGSYDDYFYAIYANGTMKWKFHSAWGTANSAAIAEDGTIYVGTAKLYARNPDGSPKWAFNLGDNKRIGFSSPAISADGTIYIGVRIGSNVEGGEIIAVNPDGTERWRKKISTKGDVDSSPAIAEDGTVYIGCAYDMSRGYLHAFGSVESNSPPDAPSISGQTQGKVGEEYRYTLKAVDPDNNPVCLFVDWDDGDSGWVDWYASGEQDFLYHTWTTQGDYTIKAKVKDVFDEESDWATFDIKIERKSREVQQMLFYRLLEQFLMLRHLLRL